LDLAVHREGITNDPGSEWTNLGVVVLVEQSLGQPSHLVALQVGDEPHRANPRLAIWVVEELADSAFLA
jgi:hypothetical protein